MKDLMIILCVLLVILTLISILGGSIRYNEDPGPKLIQPDPPNNSKPEPFDNNNKATVSSRLKDILKGRLNEKKVTDETKPKVEGFQGYEFAMF